MICDPMFSSTGFSATPPKLVIIGATGWYGKTFVHEYIREYGFAAASQNLLLYASRQTSLSFAYEQANYHLDFDVFALEDSQLRSFDEFDGLVWLSFLLRSSLAHVSLENYRDINNSIAFHVFNILRKCPHLRTVYFSSGVAFGLDTPPEYEVDPYVHLKVCYQRELAHLSPLTTVYPYATLGSFVPPTATFAAASFVRQAITTGRIVIDAHVPVVRSYGSVHDFTRLLLCLYKVRDWCEDPVPSTVVPVTHTLDLLQLAHEVLAALCLEPKIICSVNFDMAPSMYIASVFTFGSQLEHYGLTPTPLQRQILQMSKGFLNARVNY